MLRRGKRTKICVHILCNTLTCGSYDLALPAIIVEDRFSPLEILLLQYGISELWFILCILLAQYILTIIVDSLIHMHTSCT